MKISPLELLADPVGSIDRIVKMASDSILLHLASDTEMTPRELAAVAELNAEMFAGKREEIRLLMIRELRRYGAPVSDDYGIAPATDLHRLKPLGSA